MISRLKRIMVGSALLCALFALPSCEFGSSNFEQWLTPDSLGREAKTFGQAGEAVIFYPARALNEHQAKVELDSLAHRWVEKTAESIEHLYRGATISASWQDSPRGPARDCDWALELTGGGHVSSWANLTDFRELSSSRSNDSTFAWSGHLEGQVNMPYKMWSEWSTGRFAKPRQERYKTHTMKLAADIVCDQTENLEWICRTCSVGWSHESSSVGWPSPVEIDMGSTGHNLTE